MVREENMQISMQISYVDNFRAAVDQVVRYEKFGLDAVWISEVYGFDAPTLMGYLAAKTSKIKIGSGILPIYSRSPALIAQTAAGLDEVSEGRAILGLGASGPQVIEGWHGVAYDRPVGRTKEIIQICRNVWARQLLQSDGIYQIPLPAEVGTGFGKPLKLLTKPARDNIPIFVASLGPKSVEMTFAHADGWLPIFYIPEKANEVWGNSVRKGLSQREPQLGSPEIVGGGLLAIGDNVEHLIDLGRATLALYIGGMGAKSKNFYFDLACNYGFEENAIKIREHYLNGEKDRAMAEVPEDLLRATSLIGPKSYIEERMAAYKESGVTVMNVTPVGTDADASFEKFAEIVHSA